LGFKKATIAGIFYCKKNDNRESIKLLIGRKFAHAGISLDWNVNTTAASTEDCPNVQPIHFMLGKFYLTKYRYFFDS
jgi:hypothetical protein